MRLIDKGSWPELNRIHQFTEAQERFFWEHVNATDDLSCWEWQGTITKGGYGCIKIAQKSYRAHRLSWVLVAGAIPRGWFVCHQCDNPSCINPSHLFVGPPEENVRDKMEKGRHIKGRQARSAKLMPNDILAIRNLYESGVTQVELSGRFMVSRSNIGMIVRGDTWGHIGGPLSLNDNIGEHNVSSKLTEKDVVRIRSLCLDHDMHQIDVADMFGVSSSLVQAICAGKTWRHILGEGDE